MANDIRITTPPNGGACVNYNFDVSGTYSTDIAVKKETVVKVRVTITNAAGATIPTGNGTPNPKEMAVLATGGATANWGPIAFSFAAPDRLNSVVVAELLIANTVEKEDSHEPVNIKALCDNNTTVPPPPPLPMAATGGQKATVGTSPPPPVPPFQIVTGRYAGPHPEVIRRATAVVEKWYKAHPPSPSVLSVEAGLYRPGVCTAIVPTQRHLPATSSSKYMVYFMLFDGLDKFIDKTEPAELPS